MRPSFFFFFWFQCRAASTGVCGDYAAEETCLRWQIFNQRQECTECCCYSILFPAKSSTALQPANQSRQPGRQSRLANRAGCSSGRSTWRLVTPPQSGARRYLTLGTLPSSLCTAGTASAAVKALESSVEDHGNTFCRAWRVAGPALPSGRRILLARSRPAASLGNAAGVLDPLRPQAMAPVTTHPFASMRRCRSGPVVMSATLPPLRGTSCTVDRFRRALSPSSGMLPCALECPRPMSALPVLVSRWSCCPPSDAALWTLDAGRPLPRLSI